MLKFNSNGLLTPATIIKSTVQELEQVFVISPDQKRRADIWRKYIIYSNALKDTLSNIELFGVDAYIVKIYNADDKKHPIYLSDQKYWIDNFDKARMNRKGQKLQKGLLEIIY